MSPWKKRPLLLLDCPNCGGSDLVVGYVGIPDPDCVYAHVHGQQVRCSCGVAGPWAENALDGFGNPARKLWNNMVRRGKRLRAKRGQGK